ncbi:Uncharacterized protein PECH_000129 [Penicillium ucsense]|uniref:F-box domain-containing protein n=1 Tax=Penicillium ucsense TaxID=2839758 RepID=A0A8J8WK30_9EURO|nr:Uncharacterized protein PECM_005768 [Penicillium ucsense]KAF7739609.1 Uncharacterized protein PECH_000129 [Penicillium ucsense]
MSLSTLPAEIIVSIATYLDDEWSINALHQANRRLYCLLQDFLYQHNVVHSNATALEWSARNGCVEAARNALKARVLSDQHYSSALPYAALAGHAPLVQMMIDHGTNPYAGPDDLICGVSYDFKHSLDHDGLRFELFDDDDDDAWESDMDADDDEDDLQGLMLCDAAVLLAAFKGHSDVVDIILNHGDSMGLPFPNRQGSPLHVAARQGHLEIGCVCRAAYGGHTETVELLLSQGAETSAWDDWSTVLLLVEMAFMKHFATVETLKTAVNLQRILAAGDPNDIEPGPLLMVAAACGWKDYVQLLLGKGVPPEVPDSLGWWTPVNWRKLSENRVGSSALAVAAGNGRLDIVKLLITEYPEIIRSSPDDTSVTGLMWAVTDGYADIVKLLLDAGADPNTKGYLSEGPVVLSSVKWPEIMGMLLDAGAATSQLSGDRNIYMKAICGGHVDALKVLEEKNVPWGWTSGYPVSSASRGGCAMVEYVLSRFVVPPEESDLERVYLCALRSADVEMVEYLYRRGLIPNPHAIATDWGTGKRLRHPLGLIRSPNGDMHKVAAMMDTLIAKGVPLESVASSLCSDPEVYRLRSAEMVQQLNMLVDRGLAIAWRSPKIVHLLCQGLNREHATLENLEAAHSQVVKKLDENGQCDKDNILAILRRVVAQKKFQQLEKTIHC